MYRILYMRSPFSLETIVNFVEIVPNALTLELLRQWVKAD